jgi:hypothetical protein
MSTSPAATASVTGTPVLVHIFNRLAPSKRKPEIERAIASESLTPLLRPGGRIPNGGTEWTRVSGVGQGKR